MANKPKNSPKHGLPAVYSQSSVVLGFYERGLSKSLCSTGEILPQLVGLYLQFVGTVS